MLLDEQVKFEDDKLIVKKTHDNTPYFKRLDQIREAGAGLKGEHRLVGSIPIHILKIWLQEAGVSWDDRPAIREIIRKKMLSGDFDKLRVWKGSY